MRFFYAELEHNSLFRKGESQKHFPITLQLCHAEKNVCSLEQVENAIKIWFLFHIRPVFFCFKVHPAKQPNCHKKYHYRTWAFQQCALLSYHLWPCCPTQWSALNPQVASTKLSLQQEHQAFLKSSPQSSCSRKYAKRDDEKSSLCCNWM